jgi:hypothetical protein
VSWETGIDYLCIDELHDYKNLLTPSSIQDAAITPGSVRATDLHMKIEYLRNRYNGRAFTGATATPIAKPTRLMSLRPGLSGRLPPSPRGSTNRLCRWTSSSPSCASATGWMRRSI